MPWGAPRVGLLVVGVMLLAGLALFVSRRDPAMDSAVDGDSSPRRPNIIVVLTDDQRFDTVDATHARSRDEPDVPAMPVTWNRLAGEGVVFTHAIAPNPICAPSRGSFFTGRHSFRHGMLANGGPLGPVRFDDSDTIATRLSNAGYHTAFLGKYTNGFTKLWTAGVDDPLIPPGWDEFTIFNHPVSVPQTGFSMLENGVEISYAIEGASSDDASLVPADGSADGDSRQGPYSTDVLAARALDFIDLAAKAGPERPFALWISTTTPHYPWDPAPRHVGAFDEMDLVVTPDLFEEDVSDKPAWVRERKAGNLLSLYAILGFQRTQMAMQLSTDEMIEALLDRLDSLGIAEDTIFVFTSDNGYAWGEHRWGMKACPYDPCLRIPLIIRYPRATASAHTEAVLAASIDLVPTLLEFAGVAPPTDLDGTSLADVVRGESSGEDRQILIEAYAGRKLSYAGLRSARHKYVSYRTGEREFYDLLADPYELENLIDDPSRAPTVLALQAELRRQWPGFKAVFRGELSPEPDAAEQSR